MMFKTHKKKNGASQAPQQKAEKKDSLLTREELLQAELQMSYGCSLLPMGAFPDGIWFSY